MADELARARDIVDKAREIPGATIDAAPYVCMITVPGHTPLTVTAVVPDVREEAAHGEGDLAIRGGGAELTPNQLAALRKEARLKFFADAPIYVAGAGRKTDYVLETGANELHAAGITGKGIGVAVVDTGIWATGPLVLDPSGRSRIVATYDATVPDHSDPKAPISTRYLQDIGDPSGHGTHIASILASSDTWAAGKYEGIAPGVKLVSVRAFGKDGSGTYFDVIRGIDWVVANAAVAVAP